MEIELFTAPGHARWPTEQSSYPAPRREIAAGRHRIYLEYGVRVLAASVLLRRAEGEKAHITHFVLADRSICPTSRGDTRQRVYTYAAGAASVFGLGRMLSSMPSPR